MGAARKLMSWAAVAALAAWLFRRVKGGSRSPEGTWRDAGSPEGWGSGG